MESIEKLQSLYQQLDQHVSAGEDVVADLRKEINNLELSYLKDEVLPSIARILGSMIMSLRCELDCSIQFNKEKQLKYTFCTSGSTLMIKGSILAADCVDHSSFISKIVENKKVEFKPEVETAESTIKSLRLVDYSVKAFAVYGDSRHFSEIFKERGGYFNAHLKEGPGWIFSKKRRQEIEDVISREPQSEIAGTTITQTNNLFSASGVPVPTSTSENEWLRMFKSMKCMPYGGFKAPHKAIFIMALIDCVQRKYIRDNRIYPSLNFIDAFKKSWSKYVPSNWPFTPNFFHPYIHLSSEPFYQIVKNSNRAKFDINQNWNSTQANRYVKYGLLDEKLFQLLKKHDFANKVKAIILETFLNQSQPTHTCPRTNIPKNSSDNYLENFRHYLINTPSKHGKPFSSSSINAYIRGLKHNFIQSLIEQFTSDGQLDSIEIAELERLNEKVKFEVSIGNISNLIAVAFRLYISYRKSLLGKPLEFEQSYPSTVVSTNSTKPRKAPNIGIKSISAEHIHITQGNPTTMLVKFVNEIGPELIADMHIGYLGGALVGKEPNPKYITSSKQVDGGYWLNTNSSTPTKMEQITQICRKLGMEVKIELQEPYEPSSARSEMNAKYMFNGHGPLNKQQTVLACVRLFMSLNPRSSFEVVQRNFPPELQGSYGVVAELSKIKARNYRGYDDYSKYFLDNSQIFKTKDGVEFAVCLQWDSQFSKFQVHVKKRFGWEIKEI